MDVIDKQLLSALSTNARTPVSALAAQLGIARTTVQARMERLERNGTITGYTLRLGDELRAARIYATVLLQLDPSKSEGVIDRLRAVSQVEEAFSASGRFDLVLQLSAETTRELDETLDKIGALEGVKSSESLIRLSTKIDRCT